MHVVGRPLQKKIVASHLKMLAAQVNIKNPALVVTLF
jgi:hypothetical protein